jgi:hypothetical protein
MTYPQGLFPDYSNGFGSPVDTPPPADPGMTDMTGFQGNSNLWNDPSYSNFFTDAGFGGGQGGSSSPFDFQGWLNIPGLAGAGNPDPNMQGGNPVSDSVMGTSTPSSDPNIASNDLFSGIKNLLQGLTKTGQPGPGGTTAPSGLQNLLSMLQQYKVNNGAYNNYQNLMNKQIDPNLGNNRSMLADSYAHPENWLGGPEGKALADVVSNKYDRLAASGGLNANPIGRARELQNSMMLGLGNYRQGLNSAIQTGQTGLDGAGKTIGNATGVDPTTPFIKGIGASTSSGNGNGAGDLASIIQQMYGSLTGGKP